jgi:hypothetical protein
MGMILSKFKTTLTDDYCDRFVRPFLKGVEIELGNFRVKDDGRWTCLIYYLGKNIIGPVDPISENMSPLPPLHNDNYYK